MSVRFDRSEVPGVIRLDGEIDIGCAAELKAVLEEALAVKSDVSHPARVSLSQVTAMDVTAVQLLWAAQREALLAGRKLALEDPVPEALRAMLRAAGLERCFFTEAAEQEAQG
jgi:anti-anti-sigma factor